MAVVAVEVTDATPTVRRWELPEGPQGLRSPVPRGLLCFNGTAAFAAKITTNVTNIRLTLSPPTGFVHLIKSFLLRVQSDDLVMDFGLFGVGNYTLDGFLQNPHFSITAPGVCFTGAATKGTLIYGPGANSAPKFYIRGTETMSFNVSDMSADASTAGDFRWNAEFYQFDVDQFDKYELNTPIPVRNSDSF